MTDYVTIDEHIRQDCQAIADKYKTELEKVINQYHTIQQNNKGYNYLQTIHKTRVYFRNIIRGK